jgi:hypothetical protein
MGIGFHMRHLLFSVLLLGASWAAAQNSPSQTNLRQTTTGSTGSRTTVQGCLSTSKGNYTLTDDNGNGFQVTGEAGRLRELVGHEVKITGTLSAASASLGGGSASNTTGQTSSSSLEVIEVSSVRHIAKTCISGGTSN